ncbi:MAG: ATP-grasp domain-containing protein [Lachnospiraceae bacterium]|nr:ATP-grasp domain-containing protein [Candidatus Colinaster equi]
MKKRLAIIGASEEALHTIECAHKMGIEVVAIDGNAAAAGLKTADIPIVTDISDEQATLNVLNELGCNWIQTVPIGRYLTTIGACNDALGLKGICRGAAVNCTDKYTFHKCLQSDRLRDCVMYLVKDGKIVRDENPGNNQDTKYAFPMILKPRYGSGSRGIYVVNNEGELISALNEVTDEEYVLEQCIDGEEYGVDGAVIDGRFHLVLLRHKENTPLPMRQAVAYYSVDMNDAFRAQVNEYMTKVVVAMGLDDCLMHADILRSANGPFVIEASGRPSGHNLHNLFTPLATDIDVATEYMKYQMGDAYSFTPAVTRNIMIRYFDYTGKVAKVPTKDDISKILGDRLVRWVCNIAPGDVLEPAGNGHALMGRGYYIVSEPTDEDSQSVLQAFELI